MPPALANLNDKIRGAVAVRKGRFHGLAQTRLPEEKLGWIITAQNRTLKRQFDAVRRLIPGDSIGDRLIVLSTLKQKGFARR